MLRLHKKLSVALTGTVAVTNGSATVEGTGTAFTTELNVGDAIKIVSEVFTISTITDADTLVLNSTYQGSNASGLTAYKDNYLLDVKNGDLTTKFYIDKSGNNNLDITTALIKNTFVGNKGDGMTEAAGATTTRTLIDTQLTSHSGTNWNAGLMYDLSLKTDFNYDLEFSCYAKIASTTNRNAKINISGRNNHACPNLATEQLNNNFGFYLIGSTLYAANNNGAGAGTNTTITGITTSNWNEYRIVFDAGNSVKFYINDVLKVTHTTNLPTAAVAYFVMAITTLENVAKTMYVANNYWVKMG